MASAEEMNRTSSEDDDDSLSSPPSTMRPLPSWLHSSDPSDRATHNFHLESDATAWESSPLSNLASAVLVTGAFPHISCLYPPSYQRQRRLLEEAHRISVKMHWKSCGPIVCMNWTTGATANNNSSSSLFGPGLVAFVVEHIEEYCTMRFYGRPPSLEIQAIDVATGTRLLQFCRRPFDLNGRSFGLDVFSSSSSSENLYDKPLLFAGDEYASMLYVFDAMSGEPAALLTAPGESWWTTQSNVRIRVCSSNPPCVFAVGGPGLSWFDLVRGEWMGRTPVAEEEANSLREWVFMRDVAFFDSSSSNKAFWTVSRDRTLRLWNGGAARTSGKKDAECVICQNLPAEGNGIHFASDFNLVLVGLSGGSIIAFDSRKVSSGSLFRSNVVVGDKGEIVWNIDRVDTSHFVAATKPDFVSLLDRTGKVLESRKMEGGVNGMCSCWANPDSPNWERSEQDDERFGFLSGLLLGNRGGGRQEKISWFLGNVIECVIVSDAPVTKEEEFATLVLPRSCCFSGDN